MKKKLILDRASPRRVSSSNLHAAIKHPQTTKNKASFRFKPSIHTPKHANKASRSKKTLHAVPVLPLETELVNGVHPATNRVRHARTRSDVNPTHSSSKASLNASLKPNSQRSKKHLSTQRNPASQDRLKCKAPLGRQASKGSLKFPLTPAATLKNFANQLTSYEQAEILNCSEVFFFGTRSLKIKPTTDPEKNYGYDDERGDYNVVIGDHIAYRYEVVGLLGSGSFGKVLKVVDHKYGRLLALKIIRNKGRFHQQAAVEIKVLKFLKSKDTENAFNVIHLQHYFPFRHHVCITFELYSISLFDFLKKNSFQGFSLKLIRRFATQILQALRVQAVHKIIHCDLKPENILLKHPNQSALKVIDYGSACFESEQLYTYIQSRFYRAPEIMLGLTYTPKIDMWSFGCILVELFTGYPLFPGECEHEQLLCIMEVLGLPSESLLLRASRKSLFFEGEVPIPYTNKRGKTRVPCSKNLQDILAGADPRFIDLVLGCLEWEPERRLSPKEALEHSWVVSTLKHKSSRGNSMQPSQKRIKHSHKPSLDEKMTESILGQSMASKLLLKYKLKKK